MGRAVESAGLLPPSKEGPALGNLPCHVPGEYCVICTHIHTNMHLHACKHTFKPGIKDLHTLTQAEINTAVQRCPTRPDPQDLLLTQTRSRTSSPTALRGWPSLSLTFLPLWRVWAGSRTPMIMTRNHPTCPSLWQFFSFPYATACWPWAGKETEAKQGK